MDKFLDTYDLPKLNHKDKENLNRPIMSNKAKQVSKFPNNENRPQLDGFNCSKLSKF
jgi:hypothetical protein